VNTSGDVLSRLRAISGEASRGERYVCLGLGSDLDRVISLSGAQLEDLCSRVPAVSSRGAPAQIRSEDDLAAALLYLFREGQGGEIPITESAVCALIDRRFSWREEVGGTGARAAAGLCALGVPCLVHFTFLSRRIVELLPYPALHTVERGTPIPIADVLLPDDPVSAPHYIFEFDSGDRVRLNGRTVTCPCSNRLIAPFDAVNRELPISADFLRYVVAHGERLSSLVLSGFNSVANGEILRARLAQVTDALERLRARNTGTVVFLESAAYHVTTNNTAVLRELSPRVDVVSMNEDELAAAAGAPLDPSDVPRLIDMIQTVSAAFGIPALVIHTKDYSIQYGTGRTAKNGLEPCLRLAHALASARAVAGRTPAEADIERTLRLDESEVGIRVRSEVAGMRLAHPAIVCPAPRIPGPVTTIGLGDLFVAGFQIGLQGEEYGNRRSQ
jgi:ADP-dependent phosphofructokinase/glucokinase